MTGPGRILFLDPWAGAAGDMIIAALLDAGRNENLEDILGQVTASLGLEGVDVEVRPGTERGLRCLRFAVSSRWQTVRFRDLASLRSSLACSSLPPGVAARAARALERLAGVEAALHGVTVDQVHFHELGAVDTLIDVTAAFALIEALGVDRVFHGPVPVGTGSMTTAHGRLGLPAPATLELLKGAPVHAGPETGEVTTPTGALLLTELGEPVHAFPAMTVEAVGYGAGSRPLEHGPNILRAVLGRPQSWETRGELADAQVLLQAVIDDLSPEVVGHLANLLLDAGALDVWSSPVFMKKGRPGTEISVLCRTEEEGRFVDLLFRESSTFGVRRLLVSRHLLSREWVQVDMEGQSVRVKVGRWGGEVVTLAPEFEEAKAAAAVLGRPVKEVLVAAAAAARSRL